MKLTNHKTGIESFKVFADGILFLANDPERVEKKKRKDKFGSFTHFEQEKSPSSLYYVNYSKIKEYQEQLKNCTEEEAKKIVKPIVELSKILDEPLKIVSFVISPLNDAIYLNCRSKDELVFLEETSSYQLRLDPIRALEEFIAREQSKKKKNNSDKSSNDDNSSINEEVLPYLGELTRINLPRGATVFEISPEGKTLLIKHKERDNMFYTQSDLWVLDLTKSEDMLKAEDLQDHLEKISQNLDQEPMFVQWAKNGIFISYVDGSRQKISKLTKSGDVNILDLHEIFPFSLQFDISENHFLTFIGTNETTYPEVFVASQASSPSWTITQVSSFGEKIKHWDLGTVETIHWTSKDGTEIEGVLHKPANFDPNKKYPLVFLVHGGPAWYSAAYLVTIDTLNYYPIVQFNHKDILILEPNYRGSLGRGQAFLELNKDNLGIGDLWDLESAIEYLNLQGYVDTSKIGCMGWSQGGYISAFVATHSDKFQAVSVGAGVSDWYTYHIANDIPQFTTHYLSGTPFKNRGLYSKTAPMSKIQQAKTPTLIQHGAKDQRVPLANATELYRGLKDMGVPVELFVYPEMAHPITKPRENRAVMHQNLTWFSHYLLGEKLDFYQEEEEEINR